MCLASCCCLSVSLLLWLLLVSSRCSTGVCLAPSHHLNVLTEPFMWHLNCDKLSVDLIHSHSFLMAMFLSVVYLCSSFGPL